MAFDAGWPHRSFFGYWQQVRAASLRANVDGRAGWLPPARGQAPPAILLSRNLPSFTDLLEDHSGFFGDSELSTPAHTWAPPWLARERQKGFCFVFMFSQPKPELARAQVTPAPLHSPKPAPEGASIILSQDEFVAVERAAWALRGKWDGQALSLDPLLVLD